MASSRARPDPAPTGPPVFEDRTAAGVLLGAAVAQVTGGAGSGCVVLGLPRGGVPVAAGVARALGAPLDVLIVRKIGHPAAPELGLGAIAERAGGSAESPAGPVEPLFDQEMLARTGLRPADLADVLTRERAELARRVAVYRHRTSGRPLAGGLAVVVDDGLATGVTARAALRAVRAAGATRTLLAVPVASPAAVEAVKQETDEVVTLVTPRRFLSVGEWYADFGQLTDADVLTLLVAIP